MSSEPKYTLREAARELALRECATHGHDWMVVVTTGENVPKAVICERCGQAHEVLR